MVMISAAGNYDNILTYQLHWSVYAYKNERTSVLWAGPGCQGIAGPMAAQQHSY